MHNIPQKAPLVAALAAMRARTSFHMPGHKGRAELLPLDAAFDVTELPVTDDLYAASGPIAAAQRLAARSARAAATVLLTNGSTCGVQAMLGYAARPGQRVILPRACHLSAVSACALYGLEPVWVDSMADDGGAPFTPVEALVRAVQDAPDAACVLVTRPDYYGRMPALEPLARAAHASGMLLLVDEAHGAHLNWLGAGQLWRHEPGMGVSALDAGADICVQSAHKTLNALTGGAFLNCAAGIDVERLLRCVALTQSSSPSFLIMASLDAARQYMDERGAAELERISGLCERLNARCAAWDLAPAREWFGQTCDTTRLALDVTARGITGHEALAVLAARGIDVELADPRRIVLISTVADRAEDFERLERGLAELPRGESGFTAPRIARVPRGERICSVREAVLGATERVPLARARGRVAARALGVYPPGVPLCVPGELISHELAAMLADAQHAGASLFGLEQGMCVVTRE